MIIYSIQFFPSFFNRFSDIYCRFRCSLTFSFPGKAHRCGTGRGPKNSSPPRDDASSEHGWRHRCARKNHSMRGYVHKWYDTGIEGGCVAVFKREGAVAWTAYEL